MTPADSCCCVCAEPRFNPRPVHVRLVVEAMVPREVSVWALNFSPVCSRGAQYCCFVRNVAGSVKLNLRYKTDNKK